MPRSVPSEVEELLTSEPLPATLGTSHDDRPHVAPLWYRYEDDTIEIMTTGRKLENIRRNEKVALTVQKHDEGIPEWMVTVQGTAEIVADEDVEKAANEKINEKYGVDADSWKENTLVRIDVGTTYHHVY